MLNNRLLLQWFRFNIWREAQLQLLHYGSAPLLMKHGLLYWAFMPHIHWSCVSGPKAFFCFILFHSASCLFSRTAPLTISPSFPIFHHLSALVTSLLFVAICDLFPAKASLTRSTMSTVVSPRRQCRSRFRRRIPRMSRVEFRFCFSELFLNLSYLSFPVCELAATGRRFMYRSSCFLAFACGVLWIIVTGKQHEASIAVKRLTVMNQS